MIELHSPLWLLALPLCLAPLLRRRGRAPVASLAALVDRWTLRLLLAPLPELLLSAALVCMVLALARPQEISRTRTVNREGVDILLVLDTSGSMEAEDFQLEGRRVNRLEAAKHTIARFAEGRPDDRVGLVVFGEEAFTQIPLTTDHRALPGFLRQVQLGMAGERGTAIGDAIAVASQRLKALTAPEKIMILLTDGRSNAGQVAPLAAAEAAAALGVRVYTIGVGGGGGGRGILGMFGGGGSDLDERTLRAIAERTGARYFRADDTDALREVYATIDALEKSPAEVEEVVNAEERHHPFTFAALCLLGLSLLLSETALRRLP